MKKNILFGLLLLASMTALAAKPQVNNIIFMIGDGMGLNQAYVGVQRYGQLLSFMQMPYATLQETWSANQKITDSAASGTALACGIKTNNYMIGMSPDTVAVESILAQSARNGKSTGEVVTCYIPHATPAVFVAHQPDRGMYEEIAMDYLHNTPDVVIGGGRKYFENRKDSLNLSDSLRAKGFGVYYNLSDAQAGTDARLAVMAADGHMPKLAEGRGDFLPDGVSLALDRLSRNKKGFFLMVEGSQIDMRCHSNDIEGTADEVVDFAKAVQVALDFARKDGHTLVVVTADHETGGLALLQSTPLNPGDPIKGKYTTTGHTGVPVPVYAYGPGAEEYTHLIQNSDHKAIMARLAGLK